MGAYRILIADDDPVHREVLHHYLRLSGYDLVEAADGAEALERAEADAPDLVLLDVQMPVLDGFGALRALRERPGKADLPVILLTSHGSQHLMVRGLELGAEDYVTKPFDKAVLLARVRAALRRADRYRKIDGAAEGSLADFGAHVLLQTLELSKKHVRVRLSDLNAELEVADGGLMACRYGRQRGLTALARILLTERGRFAVEIVHPHDGKPVAVEPLSRSLLQAAVEVDEARQELGRLPVAPDALLALEPAVAAWPPLARVRPLSPAPALELLVQMEGPLTDNAAILVAAFEKGALSVSK